MEKIDIEFKQYKRKGLSEMVRYEDFPKEELIHVSISEQDKLLSKEEFEKGYIARNPENHNDLWLVAKDYFEQNFEEYE